MTSYQRLSQKQTQARICMCHSSLYLIILLTVWSSLKRILNLAGRNADKLKSVPRVLACMKMYDSNLGKHSVFAMLVLNPSFDFLE